MHPVYFNLEGFGIRVPWIGNFTMVTDSVRTAGLLALPSLQLAFPFRFIPGATEGLTRQ